MSPSTTAETSTKFLTTVPPTTFLSVSTSSIASITIYSSVANEVRACIPSGLTSDNEPLFLYFLIFHVDDVLIIV